VVRFDLTRRRCCAGRGSPVVACGRGVVTLRCKNFPMRGSDLVDIVPELAPRWLVRALALALLAWMSLTGNAAPIMWYAHDKAAGIAAAILGPIVQPVTTSPSIQPKD